MLPRAGRSRRRSVCERKREESSHRAEQYQLALGAAELGAWDYRFGTGEVIWDERCRRLFGLESGDRIRFEKAIAVIHPEDRPKIIQAYVDAIAGRKEGAFNQEFRVIWPNGSTHWIASNGRIYYKKEGPARIIGVDMEITERKRMEEELMKSRQELEQRVQERTAELERKNKELQDFAFIASHDLSEPLRKIQNFGSLLENKEAERLTDAGRSYISRMTEAANRMQQLLDALLKYSRVQTKAWEFSSASLDDVLKDVLSDLEVVIKKIEADVNVAKLPVVKGDPSQLRQLFENLIGNALKYCRQGEAPVIKVYGKTKAGRCTVYVEDNGIGFDEKYLDQIFQPFQRLHGKAEYPGIGMGLAICKKIVERHEGTITARGTPGHGAVFIVTLPAYDPDRNAQ